ncbi:MAG: hypothetical protein AB8I08_02170 [Sandaracinaceae bacterium]
MKRLIPTLLLALSMTCGLAVACNPTAGVPVTVSMALESLADGRLITVSGWEVELEHATVLLGPIYAYGPDVEPVAALTPFPAVAHAHGGFDGLDGRVVRAEYLEQQAFDALSETPMDLGPVLGLQGTIDEVSLVLDAPRGIHASENGPTRGHHLLVCGVATRGEERVVFEGGLDLPDEGLTRRIDGVAVDGALADGRALVVGVDVTGWLAEADFSEFVGQEQPVVFGPDSQPLRALRLGARNSAGYAARVEGQ